MAHDLQGSALFALARPSHRPGTLGRAVGYSPSTLAVLIAALVCAAEFATWRGENETAQLILAYADWLAAHVEDWTATSCGELVPGKPRHYVRITPADPLAIDPHPTLIPWKSSLPMALDGTLRATSSAVIFFTRQARNSRSQRPVGHRFA